MKKARQSIIRRQVKPYPTYQDTVRIDFKSGAGNAAFNLSTADLLPGLDIDSAQERNVVVESCMLELMPTEFANQLLVQMSANYQIAQTPSHPFKLASSINPTRFYLDIVKLSKVAPGILKVFPVSNAPTTFIRIQIYTDNEEGGFAATGRLTTKCRVLPQRSLLTAVPLAISEESPADTEARSALS